MSIDYDNELVLLAVSSICTNFSVRKSKKVVGIISFICKHTGQNMQAQIGKKALKSQIIKSQAIFLFIHFAKQLDTNGYRKRLRFYSIFAIICVRYCQV